MRTSLGLVTLKKKGSLLIRANYYGINKLKVGCSGGTCVIKKLDRGINGEEVDIYR
ncbi:hypothetical protein RUM43_002168, partial [Polyplax serrata]